MDEKQHLLAEESDMANTATQRKVERNTATVQAGGEKEKPSMAEVQQSWAYRGAIGMLVGIFFGLVMEKSKVNLPGVIRMTFMLEGFTMFKFFAVGSAVGMLCVALLLAMGKYKRDPGKFHVVPVAVGSLMLGAGMAISGSCPGTMAVQVGAGQHYAWIIIAGAYAGVTVYSLLSDRIHASGFYNAWNLGPLTMDGMLGVKDERSMWKVGVVMALALGGLAAVSEVVSPSGAEIGMLVDYVENADSVKEYVTGANWFTMNKFAYSGIMGGIFVGLLQLPTIMLSGGLLGASSVYVAVSGHTVHKLAPKVDVHSIPYYKRLMYSPKAMQQGGMALGAALASWMSSSMTDAVLEPMKYDAGSVIAYFMGGFLFLFGARLAGGCTSGNGLSGTSQLQLKGMLAAAGIFGGGIATSLAMKAAGILPYPSANFVW